MSDHVEVLRARPPLDQRVRDQVFFPHGVAVGCGVWSVLALVCVVCASVGSHNQVKQC